jgi:YD repeat-containing protein
LIGIIYPSGAKVLMNYDAAGNMSGVSLNPVNSSGVGTNASVNYYVYDEAGQMLREYDANIKPSLKSSQSKQQDEGAA